MPEDDYLTELPQLQMAFKVDIHDRKLRGKKLESSRWGRGNMVFFYFYKPFLCPEGLRRIA